MRGDITTINIGRSIRSIMLRLSRSRPATRSAEESGLSAPLAQPVLQVTLERGEETLAVEHRGRLHARLAEEQLGQSLRQDKASVRFQVIVALEKGPQHL